MVLGMWEREFLRRSGEWVWGSEGGGGVVVVHIEIEIRYLWLKCDI